MDDGPRGTAKMDDEPRSTAKMDEAPRRTGPRRTTFDSNVEDLIDPATLRTAPDDDAAQTERVIAGAGADLKAMSWSDDVIMEDAEDASVPGESDRPES